MKLHLPTRLRAAVIACMAVAVTLASKAVATDIISVNFGTTALPTTATGEVGGVAVAGWMNIVGSTTAAVNGTHDLTNGDSTKVGSLTLTAGSNPWGPSSASKDTLAHAIQSSYLDLSGTNKWTIALDSDYLQSTAILYFSGDGNAYSPVAVNGTNYIGGTNTEAGDATSWGTRTNGVDFDDTNTITVTGNIGGTITMANVPENDAAKRATLAGLQIVDTTASILYTAGEISTTAAAGDLTWTLGEEAGKSLTDIAEADRYLGVTGSTGGTLTFSGQAIQALQLTSGTLTVSGNVNTGTLFAKSGATLTFAGTLDGGGDLVIGGLGTVNLSGTQTVGNLTVGSGTLHLNSDAVITVNGSYSKRGDALTYDTGAKMFAVAEANKDFVSGGVTINSDQAFTADLLSSEGVDARFNKNATVTISSTGGSVSFNKAADATGDITLTSTSLSATSGSTVVATGEGVTLNTTLGGLSLDSSQTLELGSGVNVTLTDTGNSINLGNATLRVNGASLTAEGLIMQNNGWSRTSHFIIDDGLVEITGSAAAGHKAGSVRLAHWSGTATDLVVNGGELRILNTSVGMGDDGQATFKVTGGVANIKGFRQVSGAKIQMTGGTLNIGEGGFWNTAGTQEFTGGTLGALSSNGWTSSLAMTISGVTIQTNVYDVTTSSLTDTGANITLSDTVTASGDGITLAGSGSLTLGKTVEGTINIADGATAVVKVSSLDNLSKVATGYTGYADDENGFATTECRLLNLADGQTSNVASVLVGEETKTVTNGVIDGSESTDNDTFLVNTTVDTSLMEDITGKNLTMNAGSTLSVTTDLAVTGTMTMASTDSTISIADGKTLDLTGASDLKQENLRRVLGAATGEGTLKLNGAEINSGANTPTTNITANIDIQGTLITNGWYKATTYNVLEGGAVTLSDTLTNQRVTWNVNGGDLTASHITLGHSENSGQYPGFLNLSSGTIKTGDLKLINPQGSSAFTMTGGTLEFTQNDSSAFDIANSSAGSFTITGGTLKADTSSWYIDTTHAYSVGGVTVETTEGHTIELKNATVTGTITNTGSLSLTGTTNVTLSDAALSNYEKTIDSSGGTAPAAGTNGWMTGAKYIYTVVKNTGELTVDKLVGSDDRTVEQSGDNYVYVSSTIDSLYVVQAEGTTTLSDLIAGDFSTAQASVVLVKDGSTLDLTSDTAATFSIDGDGTVATIVTDSAPSLNGATLADDWTGTVQLTALKATDFNAFGNADSTVELIGAAGYLGGSDVTYTSDIVLTNGTTAVNGTTDPRTFAVKLTNGSSSKTYTFAGKVSGEGNFFRWNTLTLQTYAFTGDVSEWTGAFQSNTSNTGADDKRTVLSFSGDATAINLSSIENKAGRTDLNISNDADVAIASAIKALGGTLNVTASGAGTMTFSGNITAATLTANTATVLQGVDTVLTSMSGTGSVTVNGGSLQVGSVATGLTTTVNDATLKAANTASTITGATIAGATIATTGTNGAITLSGVTITKGIDNTVDSSTNTGKLTLGGAITVDTTNLTAWQGEATGTYSEGDNGYAIVESGYELITGAATLADGLTVNGKAAADALKVLDDKIVLVTESTADKSVYYVNTTASTASGDAAEATSFAIADAATLTLASSKDITVSGKGTLTTKADTSFGKMTVTGAADNTVTFTGVATTTYNGTLTIAGTAPTLSGTFAFDTTTTTDFETAQAGTEQWSDETNSQGFRIEVGGTVYLIKGADTTGLTVTCGAKEVTTAADGATVGVDTLVKNSVYQIITTDEVIKTITDEAATLNLTGYTISIADGRTLDATASVYTGDGKLMPLLEQVSGPGTLKLAGGQYVVGSGQALATGETDISFTGDTQFNSWHAASTISIEKGSTVSVDGALQIQSKATIDVATGAELTTSGNITLGHTEAGNAGYLTISGGTVETTGIARTNTGDTAASSVTMTGGTLTITQVNDDAISGVTATISGGSLDASQAAWGLKGDKVTVGGVTVSGANQLTLDGVNLDGTVTNAGTLVLKDETITSSDLTNNGTLTISGGTLNGTLTNAGTATLSGALTIDGITGSEASTFSDGVSGFAQKTTTYTVVSGGTNTVAAGCTVTDAQIEGGTSTLKMSGTNVAMETIWDKDTTTYYVNDDVTTGSADSKAATNFTLADGKTLTIADDKETTTLNGTGTLLVTTGSIGALTLADEAAISGTDLTADSATLGKDASLSLTGAIDVDALSLTTIGKTASVTAATNSATSLALTISQDALGTLSNSNKTATLLTLTTGTFADTTALTLNGTSPEVEGELFTYKVSLSTDSKSIVVTATANGNEWGKDNFGETTDVWSSNQAVDQANFFGENPGDVKLNGDVEVNKMLVEADGVTYKLVNNIDDSSLTVAKTLAIEAGTLEIGTEVTVGDKTKVGENGTLHILKNSVLSTEQMSASGVTIKADTATTDTDENGKLVATKGTIGSIQGGSLVVGSPALLMSLSPIDPADALVIEDDSTVADVTVNAGKSLIAKADLTADEMSNAGNTLVEGALTATETLDNTGELTVGTEAAPTSLTAGALTNEGSILVYGDTTVTNELTTSGELTTNALTAGSLTIDGETTTANGAVTAGAVKVNAGALKTTDTLKADSLTIAEGATTEATGAVTVTGAIDNSGTLTTDSTLKAASLTIAEGATTEAAGAVTVTGAIDNSGTLTTDSTLNAASLTIAEGSTTEAAGAVTVTGAIDNSGTLTTDSTLNAASLTIAEGATTEAAGAVTVTDAITNNGTLTTEGALSSASLTAAAGATTTATGAVSVTGAVENGGILKTGSTLSAASLTVADGATTEAAGAVTVSGAIDNNGTLTTKKTLSAETLTIAGGATTEADGAVTVTGTIDNSGALTTKDALEADSLTIAEGATTTAAGAVTVSDAVDNNGTLTTESTLDAGSLTIAEGAVTKATGAVTVEGDLDNSGTLTAQDSLNAGSLTIAEGAVTTSAGAVTVTDAIDNSGTLTTKGALKAASLTVAEGATTTAAGAVSVTGAISNSGTLEAGKTLSAGSVDNVGTMSVTGSMLTQKLRTSQGSDLTVGKTLTTESMSGSGNVTAATLDLSTAKTAATAGTLKTDTIILNQVDGIAVSKLYDAQGTVGGEVTVTLTDDAIAAINAVGEYDLVSYDNTQETETTTDLTAINNNLKGNMLKATFADGTVTVADNSFTAVLGGTGNGLVGMEMVQDAYIASSGNLTGDLKTIADALETMRDAGNTQGAEKLGSAISGASAAAMGLALSDDVTRQLRAIRNRTTTMGVNQSVVNQDLPYFNAWVNAEGNYNQVENDGSLSGYELSSWGGTVGMDVDCTPSFTCGLAMTAMYGDFTAKSDDNADGDLNTYYVTAFGRYAKHRWTHTFVATLGLADTSLDRTIEGVKVSGDTNGVTFGGLYEVGYVIPVDQEAEVCLQPIFNVAVTHTSLDGYTESGSNIALKVDSVDMTKVTFGLGARLQAVVGENLYNRSSILEARALAKLDAGDREADTKVMFAEMGSGSRSVKTAEAGAFGAEFGVGLTVPLAQEGGNLFLDGSAEIRADYVNLNATVGYRVNF